MRCYEHGGDIYGGDPILLDFSVNTNPLGMPEAVCEAVTGNAAVYDRYPDPFCRQLTAALAKRHHLRKDRILCGNGAADLIFRISACLRPQNVLIPQPTFSEYTRAVELFGGKIQGYPLKEENGFLLEEGFLDAIGEDTDMVFLCTPNNPTGRLISNNLIRRIADRCRQVGALLVLDECFIEFTDGTSMDRELEDYSNLLLLRAFTKFYAMAGLRLGYILSADTDLLDRIALHGAEWSVSTPAQKAGVAALKEVGWRIQTQDLIRKEREFLSAELRAAGIRVFDSDANFLLIKTELSLFQHLKEQGILLRNCANFPGLDQRFLRIGIKGREENQILLQKIREVI